MMIHLDMKVLVGNIDTISIPVYVKPLQAYHQISWCFGDSCTPLNCHLLLATWTWP